MRAATASTPRTEDQHAVRDALAAGERGFDLEEDVALDEDQSRDGEEGDGDDDTREGRVGLDREGEDRREQDADAGRPDQARNLLAERAGLGPDVEVERPIYKDKEQGPDDGAVEIERPRGKALVPHGDPPAVEADPRGQQDAAVHGRRVEREGDHAAQHVEGIPDSHAAG
jgi:hypothetical protein